MRFTVWTWLEEERLPHISDRKTTAHEAEEAAERLFAGGEYARVAVQDLETREWLLSLPTTEE